MLRIVTGTALLFGAFALEPAVNPQVLRLNVNNAATSTVANARRITLYPLFEPYRSDLAVHVP
ncbi:MAG: hypothetical protein VB050_00370 [Geobacteraceae bacterium]|nr:hypothetical protein [Geobacteraceae bacterium]